MTDLSNIKSRLHRLPLRTVIALTWWIKLAQFFLSHPAWIAAVQNSVCTNLTMLSPIRVSMGAAILALATSDAVLYRRAWPLAIPALLTGLAAILILLVRT